MRGFDIAGEDDKFDRERLAKEIFELIKGTSPEWSIRIGIYGPWGSGKTTLLEYVIKHAKDAGYPVININPWKFSTLKELKDELNHKLSQDGRIAYYLSSVKEGAAQRIIKTIKSVNLRNAEAPRSFVELASKLALGATKEFLNFSDKEIKEIIEGLYRDKKRIIIVLDDLDRTNPKLIPNLLLSLNEILDLPGFSFILPFDQNKIAQALKSEHASYGTGHQFLEKIIDFSYFLGTPSKAQRITLFQEQLAIFCPFVPTEKLESCYDYLPENPRRIKALARSLQILKSELIRHNVDEINWNSLIFVAILGAGLDNAI